MQRVRGLRQLQVLAKPESDAWLAEGNEEVERRMKKARAASGGGEEPLEADQGLAQHFKVEWPCLFADNNFSRLPPPDTGEGRAENERMKLEYHQFNAINASP